MRTHTLRSIAILAGLTLGLGAPVYGGPVAAGNAADDYAKAFKFLRAQPESLCENLWDWKNILVCEHSISIVDHLRPALDLVARAAAIDHCDWQCDYDAPFHNGVFDPVYPDAGVLDVDSFKNLRNALLLRARIHQHHGRMDEAITDLLTLRTMARHVAGVNLEWAGLCGMAAELSAIQLLAHWLPDLAPDQLRRIRDHDLPDRADFRQMMINEKRLKVDWLIRTANAKDYDELSRRRVFECLGNRDHFPKEAIPRTLILFNKQFNDADRHFTELIEVSDAPWPQLRKKKKWLSLAPDGYGGLVAPRILSNRRMSEMEIAKSVMLEASIAMLLDGEEAFAKVPNPHSNQPFQIRWIDAGFEVVSVRLAESDDQPLTLKVGLPQE